MFGKRKTEEVVPEDDDAPTRPVSVAAPRQTESPTNPGIAPPTAQGAIGPSITIRGDIEGSEDLVVQGTVEGTISLPDNNLIIESEGHVNASVRAKVVHVAGQVDGDLAAGEQVILRSSARLQGNIAAPRVSLEDGCNFKGTIDMGRDSGAAHLGPKVAQPKHVSKPEPEVEVGRPSAGGLRPASMGAPERSKGAFKAAPTNGSGSDQQALARALRTQQEASPDE